MRDFAFFDGGPKPPNVEWCAIFNAFPNCTAIYEPAWIGNGHCDDMSSYSTESCGYDGCYCELPDYTSMLLN